MSALKRTNLNSVVDLRTTVDDNLALSLAEIGYVQSFGLEDTKIALGYSTIIVAGGLFYLDKKFEFKDTFNITVAGIAVYFVISAVLYYFTSAGKYKNNKYVGRNDSGQKISIAAWNEKYDPTYYFKIVLNDDKAVTSQFKFTEVFDAFGSYKQEETTSILKKEIEKIQKKAL